MVEARRESAESGPVECPSADDEQNAEDQKPDVPRKRSTKVVSHVMDAEYLMVDQSLHGVEDTPAGENETEVKAPVWCQASLPPGPDRGDGTSQDKQPRRHMKKAVCQRVDFQPGNGVHRVAAHVADHVVPLKDLVKHDAVNEAPETQAVQQTGHLRRRPTNHPRCVPAAIGHGGTVPSHAFAQTRPAQAATAIGAGLDIVCDLDTSALL